MLGYITPIKDAYFLIRSSELKKLKTEQVSGLFFNLDSKNLENLKQSELSCFLVNSRDKFLLEDSLAELRITEKSYEKLIKTKELQFYDSGVSAKIYTAPIKPSNIIDSLLQPYLQTS